ncbi:ABC transporter substrate-binding protein, partial [Asanoa sp. NPDC050611]|uniref:ABC transporter substrate-binding protein n=1 Tax=Asanoa sp. NPDC050611 TaxID=3157098 RepID=UPI0033DBEB01
MRTLPHRPVVALLAAVSLLVGGCSAARDEGSDGPVTLSVFWYGDQGRAERTEAALKLYSTRHPGVTFKVTWQGAEGYYDRLATQAVGGNAPDLFQIDDTRLAVAVEQLADDLVDLLVHQRLAAGDRYLAAWQAVRGDAGPRAAALLEPAGTRARLLA